MSSRLRRLIVVVAVCCIGIGLYFGFIHKPPISERVRILPGIEFVFTRDENAADYYAKACESLSRRTTDEHKPECLTSQERKWFIRGTSCRRSSWFPEHYPHLTDPNDKLPPLARIRDLGKLMAAEGQSAEKGGDVKKAMDIWKRVAVLGWHTEGEEESLVHVLAGIAIETTAYDEFIRHYREGGDTAEAERYGGFKQRLRSRTDEFRKLIIRRSADYPRVKSIALSHKSSLWRKEACGSLATSIAQSPSLRRDAVTTLTKVSRDDPDPLVRETARNLIPYVLGQKSLSDRSPNPRRD